MSVENDGIRVIAESVRHHPKPVFSVCIPQFNRTSFLIEACKSVAAQSFRSLEICISDDRSTDGREDELIAFLHASGVDFTYAKQLTNRRYDGNLRSAIGMARGQFIFLLGNDDRLAHFSTLESIHAQLTSLKSVHVAITNYVELGSGRTFMRVPRAGNLGGGPNLAALCFRNFSFISGVIFDGPAAKQWHTDKWDGSEMYQMYLGCRILAAGGTLLGISEICIQKDIQIIGESVDSFGAKKIIKTDYSAVTRPMGQIMPLVADALSPFVSKRSLEVMITRIGTKLYIFTYGYWLLELRRVQSWRYAFSVYRGLAPSRVLASRQLSWLRKTRLVLLYGAVGLAGLSIPLSVFARLETLLYRIAKRTPPLSAAAS